MDAISSMEFDYVASGHYANVVHSFTNERGDASVLELSQDMVLMNNELPNANLFILQLLILLVFFIVMFLCNLFSLSSFSVMILLCVLIISFFYILQLQILLVSFIVMFLWNLFSRSAFCVMILLCILIISLYFQVCLDLLYTQYPLFISSNFCFLGEGSDLLPFTSVSGPA